MAELKQRVEEYLAWAVPTSDGHRLVADLWAALNTRAPIPATPSHDRMADVRLGAEAALKAVKECTERVECGDFQHGDSGYDIYEVGKLDPARIAATVTLPDAKGCEADRGIDWYAAYERMAHNRNELWAKLKAVEAALASKESDRG